MTTDPIDQAVEVVRKAVAKACEGYLGDCKISAEEYAERVLSLFGGTDEAVMGLAFPEYPVAIRFLRMIFRSYGIDMDPDTGRMNNGEGTHIGDVDIDSVHFDEEALRYTFKPKAPLKYITIDVILEEGKKIPVKEEP